MSNRLMIICIGIFSFSCDNVIDNLDISKSEVLYICTNELVSDSTYFFQEVDFKKKYTINRKEVLVGEKYDATIVLYGESHHINTIIVIIPIVNMFQDKIQPIVNITNNIILETSGQKVDIFDESSELFKDAVNFKENKFGETRLIMYSVMPDIIYIALTKDRKFNISSLRNDKNYVIK